LDDSEILDVTGDDSSHILMFAHTNRTTVPILEANQDFYDMNRAEIMTVGGRGPYLVSVDSIS
jgi:hypothetical protein